MLEFTDEDFAKALEAFSEDLNTVQNLRNEARHRFLTAAEYHFLLRNRELVGDRLETRDKAEVCFVPAAGIAGETLFYVQRKRAKRTLSTGHCRLKFGGQKSGKLAPTSDPTLCMRWLESSSLPDGIEADGRLVTAIECLEGAALEGAGTADDIVRDHEVVGTGPNKANLQKALKQHGLDPKGSLNTVIVLIEHGCLHDHTFTLRHASGKKNEVLEKRLIENGHAVPEARIVSYKCAPIEIVHVLQKRSPEAQRDLHTAGDVASTGAISAGGHINAGGDITSGGAIRSGGTITAEGSQRVLCLS